MQKTTKHLILVSIIISAYIMNLMSYLIIYTICSVHFGIVVSKIFNLKDPRAIGSTNPGATNVFRSNKLAGIITCFLDAFKGAFCIYACDIYFSLSNGLGNELMNSMISITHFELLSVICILGHIFPIFGLIFEKTKRAKGIATFFGTILYIFPLNTMICALIWTITFAIFKTAAISSILSVIVFSAYGYLSSSTTLVYSIVLPAIIVYAHKSNIIKLINHRQSWK